MESGSEHDANGDGRRRKPRRRRKHDPFRRRRGLRRRRLLPTPEGPDDKAPRTKPRMRKLRFAVVILGLSILAFVSWIFGIMMAVAQDLPSLENRQQYIHSQNSVVYDVNGVKLATLTNNQGRIFDDTDEIAPIMKEATVAIEDQRFYEHRGVDFQGIARAVFDDLTSGSAAQGASTITQQFVKNALAAQNDRTIFQKLREAALAYHLERQWDKDKILTEYLNEIYFGEGATGIEAAARTYFGYAHPGCGEGEGSPSCASELEPWEAALLAGIISSPSAYSPRNFPDNATARRNQVLGNMVAQGYISQSDYDTYSQEPIPKPGQIHPPAENSQAPYFTSWLRQQLVDRYGAGEAFGGGLQIISSLDLELQRQAESIVNSTLSGLGPTASLVVLDNSTGAVRAMVGGPSYQDAPFNLATNGHRQPGSSFKPFTLITALQQGHSSGEVFTSAPQQIPFKAKVPKNNGKGSKIVPDVFRVNNYNDSYLGSASIATATTYSDNSVYAQLGTQVGPQNVAATAKAMGVDTDLSTKTQYSINGGPFQPYNPAIILGGLQTGVTPLEMTHAYNTLAAGGRRLSGTMASSSGGPVGIVKVTDGDDFNQGDPVPDETGASGENKLVAKQVIDPAIASETRSILATVVSSGTGKRAQNGEPTWGKTGTTDDNGDAWFCGATPKFTMCVWVGFPDKVVPMETEFAGGPVDGGTFPAEIFSQVATAYESIMAARKANTDTVEGDNAADPSIPPPATTTPTVTSPAPAATTPTAPATPAPGTGTQNAPAAPAAPQQNTAPPAGGTGGGAPAAPAGGVSPG
jgi:penicillin-binding protein 1A